MFGKEGGRFRGLELGHEGGHFCPGWIGHLRGEGWKHSVHKRKTVALGKIPKSIMGSHELTTVAGHGLYAFNNPSIQRLQRGDVAFGSSCVGRCLGGIGTAQCIANILRYAHGLADVVPDVRINFAISPGLMGAQGTGCRRQQRKPIGHYHASASGPRGRIELVQPRLKSESVLMRWLCSAVPSSA